jgi:DNA-binding transcriptional MocR family regulator
VSAREKALDADVGYQPGPMFAPDGISGKNCARLCFGYNTPEEIHEGIARLAHVFEREGLLA